MWLTLKQHIFSKMVTLHNMGGASPHQWRQRVCWGQEGVHDYMESRRVHQTPVFSSSSSLLYPSLPYSFEAEFLTELWGGLAARRLLKHCLHSPHSTEVTGSPESCLDFKIDAEEIWTQALRLAQGTLLPTEPASPLCHHGCTISCLAFYSSVSIIRFLCLCGKHFTNISQTLKRTVLWEKMVDTRQIRNFAFKLP